jgi:hypothetical protein
LQHEIVYGLCHKCKFNTLQKWSLVDLSCYLLMIFLEYTTTSYKQIRQQGVGITWLGLDNLTWYRHLIIHTFRSDSISSWWSITACPSPPGCISGKFCSCSTTWLYSHKWNRVHVKIRSTNIIIITWKVLACIKVF